MLFAIPEGKPSAQSAVSPTFATGKPNELDVPKIQDENTGGLNPRVRRTEEPGVVGPKMSSHKSVCR